MPLAHSSQHSLEILSCTQIVVLQRILHNLLISPKHIFRCRQLGTPRKPDLTPYSITTKCLHLKVADMPYFGTGELLLNGRVCNSLCSASMSMKSTFFGSIKHIVAPWIRVQHVDISFWNVFWAIYIYTSNIKAQTVIKLPCCIFHHLASILSFL